MALTIDGSNGIILPVGSLTKPSLGTAGAGMHVPLANTLAFVTNTQSRIVIDSAGTVTVANNFVVSGNTTVSGTTIPTSKTLVTTIDSQTLTNKTISGANNTLSNIPNNSLSNNSIIFGATTQALGSTVSGLNAVSIGTSSASTGAFTTLSASSTVSGTGFSTYLASPPAIGGTTPAAGNFTSLGATGNVTLGDASGDTLTINGTAVSAPNGLNVNSNQLVLSSGNLGIGTSSPVLGKLNVTTGFAATDATARPVAFFSSTDSAVPGSSPSGLYIQYTGNATATNRLVELSSVTLGSGTSGAMRLNNSISILSSGNVGIGTSSPGYNLDVVGQVRSNPASGPAYILAAGGTNLCSITSGSTGSPGMQITSSREVVVLTGSLSSPTGFHQFSPNGGLNIGFSALNMYNIPANGMSIVGSVGIGKDIPEAKLHVVGTTPAGGIYVESNALSNASPVVRVRGGRNDGNGSQSFSGGLVLERYSSASQITGGNVLGTIYFGGNYSGSSFGYAASISAVASANWSNTTTASTDLVFLTGSTAQTALGTANINYGTERLRISSTGVVTIGSAISLDPTTANALVVNSSGNVLVGGTNNRGGKLVIDNNPTAQWGIDQSGSQLTIANGANAVLAAGSGLIVLNSRNTGDAAVYLINGTQIYKLGGTPSYVVGSTPSAGQVGVGWTGSNYAIYNNVGSTQIFGIAMIRSRDAN